MTKDEQAVSPVIAVIMLIAITVVIAAVVAAFAYGIIGGVNRAPNCALVVENAVNGSTNVTIVHHGGDIIDGIIENGQWATLEIRHEGDVFPTANVSYNGDAVASTTIAFGPGDELRLQEPGAFLSGESITVVYTPTGDLLQRISVR